MKVGTTILKKEKKVSFWMMESLGLLEEKAIDDIQKRFHLSSEDYKTIEVEAKVIPKKTKQIDGMTVVTESATLALKI